MVLDSRSYRYRVRCRHCISLNSGALTDKSSLIIDTFQTIPIVRPTDALPLPSASQPLELSGRFPEYQSNKPACGGARLSGHRMDFFDAAFSLRWVSIFLITRGSSMQAITLTLPPHSVQVSISMLKTRLRRCAQVMAVRLSAGVRSCGLPNVFDWSPLPRFAGVTNARCWLLGANTPWKRVRFTLGLGTSAASRAMKSRGSTKSPGAILYCRRQTRRAEGRKPGVK